MTNEPQKHRKRKTELTSNNINALLKIKGISRDQLAIMIDVDTSRISRIILNKVPCISLPIAIKIAQALGEPVESVFIFSGDND